MSAVGGVWFDRYEVLEELGAGGMATVVLARDLRLERRVALKLLRTSDPEYTQRLRIEARITALCQHSNVVVIHEVGDHAGVPYLVLEHLYGKPLTAFIDHGGRLPYSRAIEILAPVLRALQHIHEAGVVHRDLKPDNIFVTDTGVPKLLDFGIAKLLRQTTTSDPHASASGLTRAGTIMGTCQYMAPEQWGIDIEVDHRTDIWACGILLHRLICGRHPLHPREGKELVVTAILDVPMPSMSEAAPPSVPRALVRAVDRCLQKIKDQRWQSADELLAALSPFLPDRGPEVERLSTAPTWIMGAEPLRAPSGTPARKVASPAAVYRQQGHPQPAVHSIGRQPVIRAPSREHRDPILFLAADPAGTDEFALGRQARAIQEELERAGGRDRLELVTRWAPTPLDLLRELRRVRPMVVHFAGSGQPTTEHRPGQALIGDRLGGLFFQGLDGRPRFVSTTALQEMFGAAGSSVKLVVLNGCFSDLQAEALLLHVDCVVGTRGTVEPAAAKAYAIGFFGGLGEHESVATAHKQGCAAISLEGLHDSDRPQLRIRRGVDASKLILAAPAR